MATGTLVMVSPGVTGVTKFIVQVNITVRFLNAVPVFLFGHVKGKKIIKLEQLPFKQNSHSYYNIMSSCISLLVLYVVNSGVK